MSASGNHRKAPRVRQQSRPTGGRWRAAGATVVALLLVGVALVAFRGLGGGGTDAVTPSPGATKSQKPDSRPRAGRLSDGCDLNPRGIPLCGGLIGAAYGSNTDPTAWEGTLGHTLGVRRTYYKPDRVPQAIGDVKANLSAGRISWISFKVPYSWADMADGRGDEWVSDLAGKLAKVDGPVWIAFHHEPENDGSMADWTRMQHRLSPMVRRIAPNVAYTIILTGWNQIYGPPWLSFDAVWPRDTAVDLVGFDVYNDFGMVREGKVDTSSTDLATEFFGYFDDFSKTYGVPWALAETGITDAYAERNPRWVQDTYRDLVAHHGVALVYFNSHLNSLATWRLLGAKEQDFADALASSPTLTFGPARRR